MKVYIHFGQLLINKVDMKKLATAVLLVSMCKLHAQEFLGQTKQQIKPLLPERKEFTKYTNQRMIGVLS